MNQPLDRLSINENNSVRRNSALAFPHTKTESGKMTKPSKPGFQRILTLVRETKKMTCHPSLYKIVVTYTVA